MGGLSGEQSSLMEWDALSFLNGCFTEHPTSLRTCFVEGGDRLAESSPLARSPNVNGS
jgi:hypothetical protein